MSTSLYEQLLADKQYFANLQNQPTVDKVHHIPSQACFTAPHLKSSLDKKTRVARDLALDLFLIPETQDRNDKKVRQNCYIQYTQFIRKLKRWHASYMKVLEAKAEPLSIKEQYKRARYDLDIYEKLLSDTREKDNQVQNPKAMPVNIAPLEDFKDFFDFVKTDTITDENTMKQFARGTIFSDGRMDLCKQVVGPASIQNLMDSIIDNPHINHFLLGNNIVGPHGGQCIGNFLMNSKRKCHIRTWYLAGNALDEKGIQPIADALALDHDCQSLWLKRNPLFPAGIKHLAKMLETNKSIEVLDLDNVACSDQGIQYLCHSLLKNDTLKTLYLDANDITAKGARSIANYFYELTRTNRKGITNLLLGMNRLGDQGAIDLVSAIKDYPYLERLSLCSNRIQVSGLKRILEDLKHHPSLVLLDLGMYKSTADMGELPNNFREGGDVIAEFLKHNTTLQSLDISVSHMTDQDLEAIAACMDTQTTLLYFTAHQFHRKQPKPVTDIHLCCERNRARVSVQDNHRFFKHSADVQFIDSIYRNKM